MRAGVRRTAMAGVGWLAAAAAATLIGIGGIRLIGDSLTTTPGGVLDQQDVAKALAASPTPGPESTSPSAGTRGSATPTGSDRPTGSGTGTSTPAGSEKAFSTAGGSVVAGCRGNQAYLVSWSPSPGYRVTQQETESEHVDVRFEGAGGRDEIRVSCDGGHPVQQARGGGHGK